MSHVDLPFPPDDPLYGRYPPKTPGQVFLGQLAIRGERGVLKVPAQWLLRLREEGQISHVTSGDVQCDPWLSAPAPHSADERDQLR